MKETKYYCDLCGSKLKEAETLGMKIYRHALGRSYADEPIPVCWEIMNYMVCEPCYKKVHKYIKSLEKERKRN